MESVAAAVVETWHLVGRPSPLLLLGLSLLLAGSVAFVAGSVQTAVRFFWGLRPRHTAPVRAFPARVRSARAEQGIAA